MQTVTIYGKGFMIKVHDSEGGALVQAYGGTMGRVDKAVDCLMAHRPAPQVAVNLLKSELADVIERVEGSFNNQHTEK